MNHCFARLHVYVLGVFNVPIQFHSLQLCCHHAPIYKSFSILNLELFVIRPHTPQLMNHCAARLFMSLSWAYSVFHALHLIQHTEPATCNRITMHSLSWWNDCVARLSMSLTCTVFHTLKQRYHPYINHSAYWPWNCSSLDPTHRSWWISVLHGCLSMSWACSMSRSNSTHCS